MLCALPVSEESIVNSPCLVHHWKNCTGFDHNNLQTIVVLRHYLILKTIMTILILSKLYHQMNFTLPENMFFFILPVHRLLRDCWITSQRCLTITS